MGSLFLLPLPKQCPDPLGELAQGGHKPGKTWNTEEFSEPVKLMEFSGNSVQPREKL